MSADGQADIGHGHVIEYVRDPNGTAIGLHDYHDRPDGSGRCAAGFVFFDIPEAQSYMATKANSWQVESREPLTLSPSLLCRACGDHGFIRAGRWVPA